MTGGAQGKNVYWATAQGATLGPASSNVGTFLSQTEIVLETAATVIGNLIAQTNVRPPSPSAS